METSQELTVKQKAELQTEVEEWGMDEQVAAEDIIIPKILCMQGLSKAVAEEKAQMGEFVDSLTYEVLGSAREADAKPVEVVPFHMTKSWIRYEKIGDKLEFKGIFPVTPENAGWQWDETDADGNEFRNDQCLNFFCLIKDKATDPMEMPYIISFRRTSYKNGKKLATHFAKCQMATKRSGNMVPPACKSFLLTAVKTTNDKGTFYVMDVEPGQMVDQDIQDIAFNWVKTMKTSSVKVDDSDLQGETTGGGSSKFDEEKSEF